MRCRLGKGPTCPYAEYEKSTVRKQIRNTTPPFRPSVPETVSKYVSKKNISNACMKHSLN